MSPENVCAAILAEYERAAAKFPAFHSTHEGYGVLLEEVDELWDAVKANWDGDGLALEAIQVGAMALRFVLDCCSKREKVSP
jgi:hypothetical protein